MPSVSNPWNQSFGLDPGLMMMMMMMMMMIMMITITRMMLVLRYRQVWHDAACHLEETPVVNVRVWEGGGGGGGILEKPN